MFLFVESAANQQRNLSRRLRGSLSLGSKLRHPAHAGLAQTLRLAFQQWEKDALQKGRFYDCLR